MNQYSQTTDPVVLYQQRLEGNWAVIIVIGFLILFSLGFVPAIFKTNLYKMAILAHFILFAIGPLLTPLIVNRKAKAHGYWRPGFGYGYPRSVTVPLSQSAAIDQIKQYIDATYKKGTPREWGGTATGYDLKDSDGRLEIRIKSDYYLFGTMTLAALRVEPKAVSQTSTELSMIAAWYGHPRLMALPIGSLGKYGVHYDLSEELVNSLIAAFPAAGQSTKQ